MEKISKDQKLQNYINENEVAERLGVSVKLLQKNRWESKGLPYTKFGARVIYSEPEVVEYMEKHRIETGKDLFWSGVTFKGSVSWEENSIIKLTVGYPYHVTNTTDKFTWDSTSRFYFKAINVVPK